jgi:hypothetical protein
MPDLRRALAALGTAGVLLVTGACGSSAGDATATTTAKRTSTSGTVSVDGNQVKVPTAKGTCTYDDSGSTRCVGSNGSSSVDDSGNAKLPEGWPASLDPPAGAKIVSSGSDRTTMTVIAELAAAPAAVERAIRTQLEGAGYTITGDSSGSAGGAAVGALTATKGTSDVVVSISRSTTSTGSNVSMSITKR